MKNQKGITFVSLVITIIALLILAGTSLVLIMIPGENLEYKNKINIEENCNHEFVITSVYDWFRDSYKTISKCTKCGKEI